MTTSPWLYVKVAIVATSLAGPVSAAAQTNREKPRPNQLARDSAAIMTTITDESAAFWNKDFDKWASYWIHAPYVRVMGWWARGGVTVREGWDTVGGEVKRLMQENPQPNPTATRVRRENINLQVRGNTAWVTFDQHGLATGDSLMDMAGLSRETRVLEKRDSKWRIAYSGWLLEGATKP